MIQKPSRGHYNFCIFISQMYVFSHSSAPESNKQNLQDRTLDLPSFCRYKHIPSLKNLPSPAPNESLPYWSQGNFAASFVFNFCLREFLLSAFANRFELRCEPKRLMLLYYKICPCYEGWYRFHNFGMKDLSFKNRRNRSRRIARQARLWHW